ncbi:latent-transforming growth factor beta-binding protein 2 isoform X4 [Scomber scombrus]|uniref:Latent-transforming growth factor beta-binding protein 2 isoform X4 n=1 Tax=Scomber scombrus TaxID=13677 RepID=A0AAV1QAW7_SCOSC
MCRRGFHGSRCEFSTLTSILPAGVSHRPSSHFNPPPPTLTPPPRNTKPVIQKLKVIKAHSDPPPPSNHNPSSTSAPVKISGADLGGKAEVVQARSEDRGVSKRFLLQDENQASPKSPERMEEVKKEMLAESKPVINDLQIITRDTADTEEGAEITAGLKETPNIKSPHLESGREERVEFLSRSETEGRGSVDLHESPKLETGHYLESTSELKVERGQYIGSSSVLKVEEGQYLESNSSSKVEQRLNVKNDLGSKSEKSGDVSKMLERGLDPEAEPEFKVEERLMSSKYTKQESNPGLRGEEEEEEDVGEKRKEEMEEKRTKSEEEKKKKKEEEEAKKLPLSLREAQAMLLRKTLARGGRGDKMATLLMKHIEKERKKLVTSSFANSSSSSPASSSSSSSSVKTSVKTFYTQKGQYTVHVTAADGQTVTGGGGGGGGVERIQVMFTPTICKVRCSLDRCVNYCERGNVTTLYSSSEAALAAAAAGARRDSSHGPGFRVFLCPLLCKNGGICLQKDRCICPPNFTGKFCQIPVAPTAVAAAATAAAAAAAASPSSTNEIVKPALLSAGQELTQSEFLLPLGGQSQEVGRPGAPGPSMVKVMVQHPPEASVKIHQVRKVSGFSPTLRTLSSSSHSGSAGAPAPAAPAAAPVAPAAAGIQAQTVTGDGTYTQYSGFKYCFREVKDGQCSSPLPGLRSKDTCCRGIGKAWGTTDCVLCPPNTGEINSSCPVGFERGNGTQCVDVNECLQPGLCENGICVNTGGSYSCVCRAGFILDASHGICISQSVISDEKGQCFRVLGSGQGPSSCSLPILRNITKQICCCSRVGKAWGPNCQRCPYFGSVAFKEICPAGPGYHYSASALQFNQRATEQLGGRGAPLVTHGDQDMQGAGSGSNSSAGASRSQQTPTSSGATAGEPPPQQPRPQQPQRQPPPQQPPPQQPPPQQPRPQQPRPRPQPQLPPQQPRPQPQPQQPRPQQPQHQPTPQQPRPQQPQPRPQPQQPLRGVCESRPGVCGHGRCVDQPGGKYTCVCDQGYQPNAQRTYCQDVNECVQSPGVCAVGECVNSVGSYRCVCPAGYRSSSSQQTSCHDIDECQQNPCSNGRCDNTPGSYRCVCRLGYRLSGNTCTDIDECEDPLQCPGQDCRNTPGSYRCVSCQPGYRLINSICTDIDECRQTSCSNGRCENTPGSYRCICHYGYKLQNNTCADVDECAEPSQCPGQMCVNTVGSYRCVSCQPGYTLTNRQCTDIDECTNEVCDDEQMCVNTFGSYRCECLPGYRTAGHGRQCRDINECLEGDFCFSRGECMNTAGSYTCVCSQGFKLSDNKTTCLDVDECQRSGLCLDGRCVNTEGSFECECQTGFTANPEKTTCLDVDECVSSGGSVCGSERCENMIGSYRCLTSCEPGYQVTSSGRCADINECVNQTVCGAHAVCQNLEGTYLCECDRGFTSTADGKACVDEDECVTMPGVCGSARCENVEGSFMCECDRRGAEFDTDTRECVNTAPPDEAAPVYPPPSSSFPFSAVDLPPLPPLQPGELRECYYNLAERGTCSLLATNTSQQECCCTVGEGWGLGCQYNTCPPPHTAEFLSLCPSGRGYVTTAAGAFSYRDVDECKRFHPEVCKNGVCVNNIPGYNCYCSSGYVYNGTLLECVDHDECEEENCVGGVCVNTVGSYYCSCAPPLVLDDTQRNCVNSSHLTVDENLSVCWQFISDADLMCQSPLGAQVTYIDCCCLYGEGWGFECALCPPPDTEDYASLCSSFPPLYPERFPDAAGSETGLRPGAGRGGGGGGGGGAPPYFPPYGPDSFPPAVLPGRDFSRLDYDDYSPAGGSRSGFRGRTPATFSLPDGSYGRSEYGTGYYSEGDYSPPDGSPPRPPSFRLPPDPRAETGFGARPPPPSRPDGPPLSLAPLAGDSYEDQEEDEEEPWRPGPPFPPFTETRGGGGGGGGGGGEGAPRRVYERRYESYAGLSTADDCGILHGCENGRCIRVAEGYTCDCYQGYELDMTSMTCIDVNECEDSASVEFPCVNARCVNTEGSFRCVCRRGYIMSRRPNHCVAA